MHSLSPFVCYFLFLLFFKPTNIRVHFPALLRRSHWENVLALLLLFARIISLSPCLCPAHEWPTLVLDNHISSFLQLFLNLQHLASPQNVFLWSSLAVLLPSNLLSLVLACLVFWVSRRLSSFLWPSLAVLLPSSLLSWVLACLVFWVSRRLSSFLWPNLASPLSSSPAVSLWVWSRLSSVESSSSTRASVSAPVLFRDALSVGRLSHLSIWNPSWLFEPTRDPTTDRDKISNDT